MTYGTLNQHALTHLSTLKRVQKNIYETLITLLSVVSGASLTSTLSVSQERFDGI